MKYDFDEIIDRIHDPYSFSFKWKSPSYILDMLGIKEVRDDVICLETADMDFRVAPEIIEDLKKLTDHGIFGYSAIPEEYYEAVCGWYKRNQNWRFSKDDIFYYPGTHNAIAACVKMYTKPDEGVIVLTPCYGYHSDVEPQGRKYVEVRMINDGNEHFTIILNTFVKFSNFCFSTNKFTGAYRGRRHNVVFLINNIQEIIESFR